MKKFVAFLFGILLMFSSSISYAESGKPGENVTVTFSVTQNAKGATTAAVGFAFEDTVLEFVEATTNWLVWPTTANGKFSTTVMTGIPTGTIGTIKFRIKDTAPAGTYDVTPIVSNVFDNTFNPVSGFVVTGESVTVQCTAHQWNSGEITTPATCKATGILTYTCTNGTCGETKTETIPKADHTPDTPVRENEVPATCKDAGSYDEVVYCSVCGTEISRTAKVIDKLTTHTPGTAVRENEVPATCKDAGSYDEVVYCSICGTEISRTAKVIDKLTTHTPGTAVRENEVPATCKDTGS